MKNGLIALWVTRTKNKGIDLCYVNTKNIATVDFDDDYIVVTLVNNDVLYTDYDLLMTIGPLGLLEDIDILTHVKGFQNYNPYFDMDDFKNGETHFSSSPEEIKARKKEVFDIENNYFTKNNIYEKDGKFFDQDGMEVPF